MVKNETLDDSVYWEITSWGDEFWALSTYPTLGEHDVYKRQQYTTTTSISEPIESAEFKWSFKSVSFINDAAFSGIYLPDSSMTISDISALASATAGVTSFSSATSYPTSPDNTAPPGGYYTYSPGLSFTVKAAIGAGIGIAILIGLILLGFCLRRKRNQRKACESSEPEVQNHKFLPSTNNDLKYNTETVYEGPYNNVELDAPVYYDHKPATANDYKISNSNVALAAPTDLKPKYSTAEIHELPHGDVASEAQLNQRPAEMPTVVYQAKHELE
ncbi:hypothetical protein PtrSN002B_001525 [Pyrenophora tritici-repentis]|nr:hypothetical protein Alg130_05439 [Pyrenophora tritici-repentis]KAI0604611.1 hypothetical protein TUN205_11139 [Pyrenophora tritici-repentis]KAI0622386.1 hypothetical protein TUN199_05605 [Pyrenophora tritici-repentis]KAI1544583.1 hypothetical protein PtrSN001A_002651 [Pyrenophora tritici-repentis]KAI1557156.1 hypothetical protein PtrSN002B_001525 [Pyrenophora tritici-repentis]